MYNKFMKSIQIRDTPIELYSILCEAAEAEGRSLSQQAMIMIAEGANVTLNSKQRRKNLLRNFKPIPVSKKFDSASEVSKDRNR